MLKHSNDDVFLEYHLDCIYNKVFSVMEDIKVDNKDFENVRYFFSLALEDYFGDKEELMDMADITEETLQDFFEMEFQTAA